MKAAIVVFGDLGRSPRMQNHALSLVNSPQITKVYVLCYQESSIFPEFQPFLANGRLEIMGLPKGGEISQSPIFQKICPQSRVGKLVFWVISIWVLSWRFWWFAYYLFQIRECKLLIQQNPPCLPAGLGCWLHQSLFQSRWVLDQHNLGYTILQHAGLPLVGVSRQVEKVFARKATHNLVVTQTMADHLQRHWQVSSQVLRDLPTSRFPSYQGQAKQAARSRLAQKYQLKLAEDTPLLVSPSSFSLDDSFQVLIDALTALDPQIRAPLNLVVSGRGPCLPSFLQTMGGCQFQHIQIQHVFVDAEDYPTLMGVSDLGICLHESTSGLDFPIKVLDMLSASVPVVALDFPALREVLGPQSVFQDAQTLCALISRFLISPTPPLVLEENWTPQWSAIFEPWLTSAHSA